MCRTLEVSLSGFYSWVRRMPSRRSTEDSQILAVIRDEFATGRGTYGVPRIHGALRRRGIHCSRKRVARLMRSAGLAASHRRRYRVRTTDSNHDHPIAENLLQQNFDAQGPGQAWVSDITYLPTGQGWLYLACTMDLFSRRIVGWSMAATLHADIAVDALRMALDRSRPRDGMIHHSDRGSQYASGAFRAELRRHSVTASMSRKADCYDNAVMESFFHSLKVELVYRESWHGHAEARGRVFDYIESFYNRTRLHSRLGYMSPLEYETAHGHSDSVASQATPR